MRSAGHDKPLLLAGEVVEQPADADLPQEFVTRADHGQDGRLYLAGFLDGGLRELGHAAEDFRADAPHHKWIADQPDRRRGRQLPAAQPFEDKFGVAHQCAREPRKPREQPPPEAGCKSTRRSEHKTGKTVNVTLRRGMNRDRAAHALTENEKWYVLPDAVEKELRDFGDIVRHAPDARPLAARHRRTKAALVDGERRKPLPREPRPDLVESSGVIECAVQQQHRGARRARQPKAVGNRCAVRRGKDTGAAVRARIGCSACRKLPLRILCTRTARP